MQETGETGMNKTDTLHVLFVEDSEDDKELVLEELRGEFGDIVHQRVETAQALHSAVMSRKWDIVLCDHNLPALDAPSALRIVQLHYTDMPFIIVSGSIEEQDGAAVMMAGAADMISKNNLSRLVPAIKRELQKSSAMLDLREAREQIQQIAYYDQRTGLPNREFLARRACSLMADHTTCFALMVLNLNRFLLIPRTLGVEAGNQTLRLIGERIRKTLGAGRVVASMGGDRYAILVESYGEHGNLADIVGRINEEVARPLKICGQELFLAGRIGISVYPNDGLDLNKLLINAEIAMNQVRTDGGRNYRFFDAGMNAAEQERLELEHALHRALKQNEFRLHYQPQYDLRTKQIVGVEALMRWHPAGRQPVSPADFIPVLEETGLIVQVGEWALRTACMQNLEWQRAGLPPIRVAVNLSAIQFHQAELVQTVKRVLEETGLEERYLELEITENIAMHNEESVISSLTELRDLGIHLAIDDFGTGYSSLSYLKRFPVHRLKIDRSFVNGIAQSADDASLVKAIISLAQNLRLKVIAEGVETREQEEFLRACGCEEVQGFLFSRPLPAEEIGKILEHSR
ncbi:GGDEF domain-containing response regulator [Herbaspirillum sp. HC18]|nr:GGDEF domain-containing response regulator [Herbaspirillum sp. HC18]